MSKIALEGNSLGSGTFTIAAPNSNSNPTLTLPTSSGTVVVTGGAQTIEFAAGSAASPSITFTGDTNTGIFSPGADTIAFSEGGVESMRITSAGDVGVGTTSPNLGGVNKAITLNSAASTNASYELSVNGTFIGSMYTNTADSSLRFGGWQNAPMVFLTNSTERMRIDSSGNVGIGTSSPNISGGASGSTVLTISATSSARNGLIELKGTRSNDTEVVSYIRTFNNSGATPITDIQSIRGANDTSGTLAFFTSNTERARITSGGNLLVGTTDSGGSSGSGFKISGTSLGLVNAVSTSSVADTYNYYNTTAGAYRFYVTNAGVINATSTTITAISDQRLKENIQDIDVGLDAVMALKPRKFDWKEGKGKDKKGDRGWIAQEFEQVFPEMIDVWKDPAPEGEEPYKSVNADLIPVLVKAIQELKAITDAQATRIEALEAEVAALKGQ